MGALNDTSLSAASWGTAGALAPETGGLSLAVPIASAVIGGVGDYLSAGASAKAQGQANQTNANNVFWTNWMNAKNVADTNAMQVQQAELNRQFQSDQAQRQMGFQERMSSTAHQREIADLTAAGLNPILSAKYGGSSTSSGAAGAGSLPSLQAAHFEAPVAQPVVQRSLGSAFSGVVRHGREGIGSAIELQRLENDTAVKRAQIKNIEADAALKAVQTTTEQARPDVLRAGAARDRAETDLTAWRAADIIGRLQQIESHIEATKAGARAATARATLDEYSAAEAKASADMFKGEAGPWVPYVREFLRILRGVR